MNLVKVWQEKTNEPNAVPATLKYKDIIYLYETSIYIGVGNKEIKECLKGVRIDVYRSEIKEIGEAIVYNLLNKIRGYAIMETKEYLFDLVGAGLFPKVGNFSCFDDWNMKKFNEARK